MKQKQHAGEGVHVPEPARSEQGSPMITGTAMYAESPSITVLMPAATEKIARGERKRYGAIIARAQIPKELK